MLISDKLEAAHYFFLGSCCIQLDESFFCYFVSIEHLESRVYLMLTVSSSNQFLIKLIEINRLFIQHVGYCSRSFVLSEESEMI